MNSALGFGDAFRKKVAFELGEWVGLCEVEWKEIPESIPESIPERV